MRLCIYSQSESAYRGYWDKAIGKVGLQHKSSCSIWKICSFYISLKEGSGSSTPEGLGLL